MGSVFEFITIEKAAEGLSVSIRQVYKYIKNGRLRTVKDGQKQLVKREDVTRILDEKKGKAPKVSLSKETLGRHESRIHMLEQRVALLMRIHDLHNEPMGLSAMELKGFWEMAQFCLEESWAPQQEDTWKDFFLRIQLEDLDLLSTVIDHEDPWLAFHTLCRAMVEIPHDKDLALQFRAGKQHLERLAYVWTSANRKDSKQLDRIKKVTDKQLMRSMRKITRKREKASREVKK